MVLAGARALPRGGARTTPGRPLGRERRYTEGLERLGAERAVQLVGVLDVPVADVPRRRGDGEEALPSDEWHVFAHP